MALIGFARILFVPLGWSSLLPAILGISPVGCASVVAVVCPLVVSFIVGIVTQLIKLSVFPRNQLVGTTPLVGVNRVSYFSVLGVRG